MMRGGSAFAAVEQQLADAESIGVEGIELVRFDVEEAVRLGSLDDDFAGGADADVAAEDAAAERVVNNRRHGVGFDRAAHGIEQARGHRPTSAGYRAPSPGAAARMPEAIAIAASSAARLPLNSWGRSGRAFQFASI